MKYEPIIGLEVHVQSKTKSKMFCSCSADYFGKEPNTYTCPVCLGLPGAMPVPNKYAIELCMRMALGLHCSILKETKFDRKNYFYPDLPKGYQISQYDQPIGQDGFVELEINGKKKKIGITRVHQEEDTGKSIHQEDKTYLDFNKSGVPLIEIVSEPDLRSVEEVTTYAKYLHQTARYLGVSDADMEKGQMRFELNISLKEESSDKLPGYKVEVKNIGSISVLQKVVESEIERQSDILNSGKTPVQETRGLLDMHGNTVTQRIKETSDDYRYFPEPDIPPIEFTDKYIEKIKSELPEGPQVKVNRYVSEYCLDKYSAEVVVSDISKMDIFEKAIEGTKDKETIKEVARIIIGSYSELSKKHDHIKPKYIFDLASLIQSGSISKNLEREILVEVFETGKSPMEIVDEKKLSGTIDTDEVVGICDKVIKENPDVVKDAKKNPNALNKLIGHVMKQSKGKADAKLVKSTLESLLE